MVILACACSRLTPGAQAPDGVQPMLAAIQLIRCEDQRLPEHGLVAIETARGQNPDDPVRFTVEHQIAFQNAGIAAELRLPERVAQHHHRGRSRLIFARCEGPPDLRLHAEHLKVIGRHQLARNARRIAASRHRGPGRDLDRQRLEDVGLPLPVQKGQRGGAVARLGVGVSHTLTMRSGSGKGSGFNRTASTILNMAELAPMPSASNPMATAANPGSRASEPIPYRKSLSRFSIHRTLR